MRCLAVVPGATDQRHCPGGHDPFFPVGNGEALTREIPGARLLILERASTAIPDAAAGEVATAMLGL
jgi:hypothetical protein